MHTEIIFDLETKKIFDEVASRDPADLGVSVLCLYKRELDDQYREISGSLHSFWEGDFSEIWPLFAAAERIIGFNSLKFDLPCLGPYCPYDLRKLPHLDILDKIKEKIGFRIGLSAIARETLGRDKSDVGINAVIYWQKGTPDSLKKLEEYCRQDVLITRDVYDFALKHKRLMFKDRWNASRTIEVDFSYPSPDGSSQMGLF